MMTIEEKAKAYDEALEKARCYYDGANGNEDMITMTTTMFPELAESDGEQHRKWILEYLYDGLRKSDEQFKDQFKAAIAWFEKQGEQKSTEWSEEDEKMLDIILNDINYAQKNFSDSKLIPYIRKVVWLKSLKDKYIWKPSEEQLDALETAVSACQSNTLAGLYNTLKSL